MKLKYVYNFIEQPISFSLFDVSNRAALSFGGSLKFTNKEQPRNYVESARRH